MNYPDANQITSKELNPNGTAGVVGKPSFDGGMPDNMIVPSQPVTNAEAEGELNVGYNTADLSPHGGPQDAGEGGKQWQTPE